MEFETINEFRSWVKTQPKEVALALAAKTAFRVWAQLLADGPRTDLNENDIDLDAAVVASAWALLCSQAALRSQAEEVSRSAFEAHHYCRNLAELASSQLLRYSMCATFEAAFAVYAHDRAEACSETIWFALKCARQRRLVPLDVRISADAARGAKDTSYKNRGSPDQEEFRRIRSDASNILKRFNDGRIGDSENAGLCNESWLPDVMPEPKMIMAKPDFSFFWRLYKGPRTMRPLSGGLVVRVVTEIPPETWQSGIDAVAPEIARIEALFAVQSALADLATARSKAVQSNRLGIGGNYPPEEIDEVEAVNLGGTVIWAIDELNAQAHSATPEKEKVIEANSALRQFLAWLMKKGDLAVDTAIKWSIPATGAYASLNPDKIKGLIDAVQNWIVHLP